jgi:hypothetical protein
MRKIIVERKEEKDKRRKRGVKRKEEKVRGRKTEERGEGRN